jgi:hypothetical protein
MDMFNEPAIPSLQEEIDKVMINTQGFKSKNRQTKTVTLEEYNAMKAYYEGQIKALKTIINNQYGEPLCKPNMRPPRLSPYP